MKIQNEILKDLAALEINTPLGVMTAAASPEGIAGLWFSGQKHFPENISEARYDPENALLLDLRERLNGYFGKKEQIPPKLCL